MNARPHRISAEAHCVHLCGRAASHCATAYSATQRSGYLREAPGERGRGRWSVAP